MKHNVSNKNSGDDLKSCQNLLNEILNAEPYCDFYLAKIKIFNYLRDNYSKEFTELTKSESCLFLINALSSLLDHVAYEKDLEELTQKNSL